MTLFYTANKVLAKVLLWKEIASQRKQLREMSGYLLKDIGISRADANCEAKRFFWDYSPVEDASHQRRTGKVPSQLKKNEKPDFELKLHRSSH